MQGPRKGRVLWLKSEVPDLDVRSPSPQVPGPWLTSQLHFSYRVPSSQLQHLHRAPQPHTHTGFPHQVPPAPPLTLVTSWLHHSHWVTSQLHHLQLDLSFPNAEQT